MIFGDMIFVEYDFLLTWTDCKIIMQYEEYRGDMATIERLDNSIGHVKSNCVLACKNCNNKNLGHK